MHIEPVEIYSDTLQCCHNKTSRPPLSGCSCSRRHAIQPLLQGGRNLREWSASVGPRHIYRTERSTTSPCRSPMARPRRHMDRNSYRRPIVGLTTLMELQWLHDDTVLDISYGSAPDGERHIRLSLRCPSDSGYTPWQGRNLVLIANDVSLSQHLTVGNPTPETIDAVHPSISLQSRGIMDMAAQLGARPGSTELTISFHRWIVARNCL